MITIKDILDETFRTEKMDELLSHAKYHLTKAKENKDDPEKHNIDMKLHHETLAKYHEMNRDHENKNKHTALMKKFDSKIK